MTSKLNGGAQAQDATPTNAFAEYLDARWRAFVKGEGTIDCGSCRGCCRSGLVIGLSEDEAARLPHDRVQGYAVIFPDPDGSCPMLIDGECSVYPIRPVSCRQFDCRDMAWAGAKYVEFHPGVAEINRSIARHSALIGGYLSNLRQMTERCIASGASPHISAQMGLITIMSKVLPPAKFEAIRVVLTAREEAQRNHASAIGAADYNSRVGSGG